MHLRPGIPFLFFSGAGSNIRCYIAGVNVEYRGITFSIPTSTINLYLIKITLF
jgi:hypothetical protein